MERDGEMSQKEIEEAKEKYKPGMKLKLLKEMYDEKYSVPVGEIGIIDFVDDIGTIHINWECGSSLGLIPNVDKFEEVEKIKVIIVEPEKEPYTKEIYNTLKDKQEIVDGLIQCIPTNFSTDKHYDFICNDEGKVLGLPLNRYIYDNSDVIAGNLIIAKVDESLGEFITIEDNEVDFLIDKINEECPKFDMLEYFLRQREEEELEK